MLKHNNSMNIIMIVTQRMMTFINRKNPLLNLNR